MLADGRKRAQRAKERLHARDDIGSLVRKVHCHTSTSLSSYTSTHCQLIFQPTLQKQSLTYVPNFLAFA